MLSTARLDRSARHVGAVTLFVVAAMLTLPRDAVAQMVPAQHSVTGALGVVSFDVDGVATTLGISGRGSFAPTSRVALEGNVSWVKNDETGTSHMWVAEVHVQYYWQVANRVRPFAGGGAGIFINKHEIFTDKALTLSAAAGVRADFSDRVAALGEFRMRGIEVDFVGTMAEVWGGVTVRLGR